jgi:hypothetical protein
MQPSGVNYNSFHNRERDSWLWPWLMPRSYMLEGEINIQNLLEGKHFHQHPQNITTRGPCGGCACALQAASLQQRHLRLPSNSPNIQTYTS